ncbi:MAG: TonB-dependent receptor [Ignavibacteriota bacterium]
MRPEPRTVCWALPTSSLPNDVFDKTRMRDNRFAAFMQDDWRLTPKLSLSLGLRYEYFPTFQIKGDHATNFNLQTGEILVPQEARGWVQSFLGLPNGTLPPGYQYVPNDQVVGKNIGLDMSPRLGLRLLRQPVSGIARRLRNLPRAAEHHQRQQHLRRSVRFLPRRSPATRRTLSSLPTASPPVASTTRSTPMPSPPRNTKPGTMIPTCKSTG